MEVTECKIELKSLNLIKDEKHLYMIVSTKLRTHNFNFSDDERQIIDNPKYIELRTLYFIEKRRYERNKRKGLFSFLKNW